MSAIPVSELGLNSSEARYLQQQIAASQQGSNSSRAASHASSQGRLLLDPTSLQALSAHFDRLMYSIQQRWHYLTQQTQTATQVQYDRAGNAIQMADAEIARFRAILREIDELQTEFDKVRRIGEIVKGFRSRVDRLDRRI
ncbi:biogenesis of lysosome-related organelles complex 1 subunit CNL1 [Parastagonospora nodorum]|uniref:Biogenesis of lysosome-related organelles complex 1 subunit CNL1 n=1 Tax=Phaeosphaeria nodorum (strain SN15 / ATCC MYA-4574 / FGSC 10173) TaxID=321614 RepID=A0A7U2EWN1_PHANO|nr:biogenesis of lysosome-related organelles complex 1 subunit CNL1 [Parastagonospora nodorum]QRC94508.1 biogenesis of lysosome-related organelles complex 1 subunit CNL1 [Parastagonospora nodorum SN15]KAH3928251.1 biogenesis of lysosome-related organelles complex 1 subunit CNL1 [Parastagonospora nodorum]KAH3945300.1 biogenesis of lysosome-related organelles complex 1 subunit CNL1 [Parastagonospora nodorum]KAH3984200.1 biogenesis of lysosome-related organelles complex 1 subunit CNL1 [Parastagono